MAQTVSNHRCSLIPRVHLFSNILDLVEARAIDREFADMFVKGISEQSNKRKVPNEVVVVFSPPIF